MLQDTMNLQTQIGNHLVQSIKDKDSKTLLVLRMLKAAISNAAVKTGNINNELTDEKVISLIRKQISQRKDSIFQFEKAGRNELAQNEKNEIVILEKYLPASLTEQQIQELVEKTIFELGAVNKKDLGRVIKTVTEKTQGAVDGKTVSAIASKILQ